MNLPLLYHDDFLVAVHKPAGLLVHRTALDAHERTAALQLVRDQVGAPLWPVHRLDKGTSGVLLFALAAKVARTLGERFESGAGLHKTYLALVRGWPPETGMIDHPLARDPEKPSAGQQLLASCTVYRRLARVEWPFSVDPRHPGSRYALVEVRPQSGRRHQIRRHFKHIAHPLIGDTTHGKGPLNRAVATWLGRQRLWLHALTMQFPHPWSGEQLQLQAQPGTEWNELVMRGAWQWDTSAPCRLRP